MSEPEELDILEESDGLTRRDIFVKGGLVAAGATVLGGPAAVASAAVKSSARADKKLSYAVITHGAGDVFWAVVKKGVAKAASDLGVSTTYSESFNKPDKQAQLIDTAVARKPNGIAVSAPNASAIKDSLKRAEKAGIIVITLNSGVDQFKQLGALTHVGQTENIAGAGAGQKLAATGAKHLLVIFHEAANIGLEQRFAGAKSTFKGKVSRVLVKGVTDVATSTNEIRTKLQADKSIDAILALNPQMGIAARDAAKGVSSKAKIGTFDLSSDVIKAIQAGQVLFAVDQQQYEQGYLPIVFMYLYNINLNTVGGGKPVLTGPGFVDKSNAAKVAALAKKGTR